MVPSHLTAAEFGKVRVKMDGGEVEVELSILMEPQGVEAEGWQTGVALDGSSSMQGWYGRVLEGKVPPDVMADYERRGWIELLEEDGRKLRRFQQAAYEDAVKRAYLRFSPNVVEALARDFIAYLAGNLDADGGTTVIYWACGKGDEMEVVGDFTADQCRSLGIQGPTGVAFGVGTHLEPAVRYFVDRFKDAKRGMYVFVTDGKLDDLEGVKRYCTQLAKDIEAGRRNPVKCVLVGVGSVVDEGQMEELDNLETGTEVDIWDHKIAKDLRSVVEIFAEVVSENQIVAPVATVYAANGGVAKKYTDGLPARISFRVPGGSEWFELEVGGQRIRQVLKAG